MSAIAQTGTVVEVIARRDGRWWVFEILPLDVTGQAADLSGVADEARGIIAAWDADEPAAARRREAVALLRHEKGYSAAQTAQVLGVSRQRIYQLGATH